MLELARDFIKNCKGKTVIVYDTDGDGIGAAVILSKTLKKLSGKYPKIVPRNHGLSLINDEMVKKVKGFDSVIFLDMTVDEEPEYVLRLAKKARVMIIDHHQPRKNLNRKNVLHVNPVFWEKKIPSSQYCTSKITYDICSKLVDNDFDWLAGMGMINDKAENSWKVFLKKIYDKYDITPKSFELVNDIITSSYMFSKNKNINTSYKACLESGSPVDILEGKNVPSRKLKMFYNAVEKEIESTMKKWEKNVEIFEGKSLIILELDSKFSISSTISTKISFEKPHYTVLVSRKDGKFVSISLRRQDRKVDCGMLAKKLTKNLKNSSGGGHAPAAGIKIMKGDWKKLRNRVLEIL